MKIRAGFEIAYDCPQPTPMILQVSVHPSRQADLITWDGIKIEPGDPRQHLSRHLRQLLPRHPRAAGRLTLSTDFLVQDSGELDPVVPDAMAHMLEELPVDALIFLLGSRYCETDRLSDFAWSTFGHLPKGWPLVQAICDFAHERIKFGYEHASPTKTAFDAFTGAARRVPRLRASRRHAVPLHEHSGALLHRLSRRHGHAAALSAREISPRGSRPISAGAGTSSIRATTCRASAAS